MTSVLYRACGLSVLSYIMQLHEVPQKLLEAERDTLRKLVPGPGKSLPAGCSHRLPELFSIPAKFTSTNVLAAAIRPRVSCTTLTGFNMQVAK